MKRDRKRLRRAEDYYFQEKKVMTPASRMMMVYPNQAITENDKLAWSFFQLTSDDGNVQLVNPHHSYDDDIRRTLDIIQTK